MKITSTAFEDGGEIPSLYTCEGKDISPPLSWTDVPADAKSLVLIVEDPDAPDPKSPKMVWIHWILYNIDPKSDGLPENVKSFLFPAGTEPGTTSWDKLQYGGPCPPIGRHRYFHKLYALDKVLPSLEDSTIEMVKNAMKDHIIAEAVIMGTYEKASKL